MKLSTRLAKEFGTNVRDRGEEYFWRGRVRIEDGSDTEVEACVRGSETCYVSLEWNDGVLGTWCDCSYFIESGIPCKHLWASILSAESQGYLTAAALAPHVVLDTAAVNLDELEDIGWQARGYSPPLPVEHPKLPPTPLWRQRLTDISNSHSQVPSVRNRGTAERQILYLVDVPHSWSAGSLVLRLASRDRKPDGSWKPRAILSLKYNQIDALPQKEDREILSALTGGMGHYAWGAMNSYDQLPVSCSVPDPLASIVLPRAALTGRCHLQLNGAGEEPVPIAWDEGGPWQFKIAIRRRDQTGWEVVGAFHRGTETMDLAASVLTTSCGFMFTRERVAPLVPDSPFKWIRYLHRAGRIEAPEQDKDELLGALLCSPGLPPLDVPEELRYEEVVATPRPRLLVRAANPAVRGTGRLMAAASFDYEGRIVPELEPIRGFYDAPSRRFLRRDPKAEDDALGLLGNLGFRFQPHYGQPESNWELAPSKLPRAVRMLIDAGWHVEAQGKIFRRPSAFRIEMSTGVDWFELHGEVEYGDSKAKLPDLLAALRRGDNMVRLDDGTYGVLPEDWLRRLGPVAGLGTAESDHIRFRPSQLGLLDALLATQPEARCDETFDNARRELRLFQGVKPADQPAGFQGQLRDYQREGLGWMHFLRRFSFGGCLADDMGVGKTAQVLALLETRRELRAVGEPLGPSLAVVPRSLIFNWKQEAARFTPQLRVFDYSESARKSNDFSAYDMILATYGTLRRNILQLKDVVFDYVVLDEAQAVKNASTESAKAVRLLQAKHRLALSGTPVQNHLGELWALFDFLNPGMLGAASVFKLAGTAARNPDHELRALLATALRPFFLRRTKEQVARELPEKTEQIIYCEMEPAQRKLYDELRQHYRNALLTRIEAEGMAKSKIQVLEALLRLRQAACHPGLLDSKRSSEASAKLDVLLAQLGEVLEEGHKALVFSQFTSLLRIVRDRLEARGMVYEYLDGSTTNRQAPVERFQNDAACRLFLISLKAGGLGLNLTAADYVFLLDPWWNPAVEAQAMDRAHRIGQTRQVFAYRLIARDSVEEKVLELQKTKRDLAAAIVTADNSVIRDLRREDLELLLS
jgi:superfamily II DNA or RNA helicase